MKHMKKKPQHKTVHLDQVLQTRTNKEPRPSVYPQRLSGTLSNAAALVLRLKPQQATPDPPHNDAEAGNTHDQDAEAYHDEMQEVKRRLRVENQMLHRLGDPDTLNNCFHNDNQRDHWANTVAQITTDLDKLQATTT